MKMIKYEDALEAMIEVNILEKQNNNDVTICNTLTAEEEMRGIDELSTGVSTDYDGI